MGKKKNKNKGGAQQPQQQQQQQQQPQKQEDAGFEMVESPPAQQQPVAKPNPPTKEKTLPKEKTPPKEAKTAAREVSPPKPGNVVGIDITNEALKQLSGELPAHLRNFAELREAEKKYALMMQGKSGNGVQPASKTDGDDSDHVDLFASDDDEEKQEKPKMTKPKQQKQPQQKQAKKNNAQQEKNGSSNLKDEIARARQHINLSLACVDNLATMAERGGGGNVDLVKQIKNIENENKTLRKVTDDLRGLVAKLEKRIQLLESNKSAAPTSVPKKTVEEDDDDNDIDLFGSDSESEDEDAEKARVREERLKAYAEKKSKKPGPIAKTSVLLDIKPWDDETDMAAMLSAAKTIQMEGLVWGASKLVPLAYGIQKLQLMCVVEDEKVSIDELCERITEFEDFVQSVDIAAMSKI